MNDRLPDFKNEQNNWVVSVWSGGVRGSRIYTVSGITWTAMRNRCKVGGSQQAHRPTYVGVVCNFTNFNSFVEWSRRQAGYDKGWHLDKDLLSTSGKQYDPDTCVFLPPEINTFLSGGASSKQGSLPKGVHFVKRISRYTVACGNKYIGCYKTEEEAAQAYKTARKVKATALVEKYQSELDPRATFALLNL